jgi:hypothetical protein
MNNKKTVKDFAICDHTWKFAYDAIGESVYSSTVRSLRVINTSVWDFGWDAVEETVKTSARDAVWLSVQDYFKESK